jgi:hypothetical protein
VKRFPHAVLLAALVAVALSGLLAPVAGAESPLSEYQRTGVISPCKHSAGSLGGPIPADVEQYAPDYQAALQDAARAGCGGSSSSSSTPTSTTPDSSSDKKDENTPGATFIRKPPAPPSPPPASADRNDPPVNLPLDAATQTSTPLPVTLLAIILLLVLIGATVAGLGRWLGWGTERLDPLRHAVDELSLKLGRSPRGP